MDKIWENSDFETLYLGEWHTHREDYPNPSQIDICNWRKIACKGQNSPWMLFIIVGMSEYRIWTIDNGIVNLLSREVIK